MSRYVFLSDLHLGSDDSVDNFGMKNAATYIQMNDWAEANKVDKIYGVGDIFELWQGRWWTEKSRLKRIRQRYAELDRRMKNWDIFGGNHDWLLVNKEKALAEVLIDDAGGRWLILHGHQFDDVYKSKKMSFLGRVGTEFWGLVEGIFGSRTTSKWLPKLEMWLERQKLKTRLNGRDQDETAVYNRAVAYAKSRKAENIIIGHTHKPRIKVDKKKKVRYIDVGSGIDGKKDVVLVDTKKKLVVLTTITKALLKDTFDNIVTKRGK